MNLQEIGDKLFTTSKKKRQRGNSINQREVIIEGMFCSESFLFSFATICPIPTIHSKDMSQSGVTICFKNLTFT